MDQNVLNIKDGIQKYLSTGGKWEIHLQCNRILFKSFPVENTYKNYVHLNYALSERRGKFLSHFQSKFEVGMKKKTFHNDKIIAAAFP